MTKSTKTRKAALGTALAAMLTLCFTALSLPALAQTPAPGSNVVATPKPKRTPTAGQLAARERQKKCAAEWKADKAAGKIASGMKWPQYWSACNKRLKSAG